MKARLRIGPHGPRKENTGIKKGGEKSKSTPLAVTSNLPKGRTTWRESVRTSPRHPTPTRKR